MLQEFDFNYLVTAIPTLVYSVYSQRMKNQFSSNSRQFIDNSGELSRYVKKCESLLESWDEDFAEDLVKEIAKKYKIVFASSNLAERVREIHIHLIFALKYL